jgi:uncharacterized membrane protein YqaE (UPF0057 family)
VTAVFRGRRAGLLDWLARGPFAMAAAALQGSMNYAIVLYLSFGASLAATGAYRTLFSCYSLLALASMFESNKVFLRAVVDDDRDASTAVFANRVVFGFAAFGVVLAAWAVDRVLAGGWVPDALVAIALISAFIYPFDSYIADLQAGRRFQRLFLVETVKYGAALAGFVALFAAGAGVEGAVLGQLAVMGGCNILFFFVHSRKRVAFGAIPGRWWAMLRSPAAGQARTYSFANMFPASLEHVDKLLVGQVFGLTFLGIYTLSYSTGRFLYNTLKPALYIYYRRFVDRMPGWPMLRRVSAAFTVLGLVCAASFLIALEFLPVMARFRDGRWVTVILFLGYGPGILHAIYSQAFALNKESVASHSFKAHALATGASVILLAAALLSPPVMALVLLGLQYPLRDGLSVLLMDRYRRRGGGSARPRK